MKKGENLEQVEVVEIASTEKKIWNWFGKYGFNLLRLGLVLVLVWGAYLLWSAWNDCRSKKHANAYAQLTTLQSRVKWAEQAHPKALRNLQGFVFLENAHALWDAGEFEKSILYFQKARDYLKISPLKEQSLAGCAFGYLQIGQLDMAEKLFLELNKCTFKYLRAQSLYALCAIAEQKKDDIILENYKKQLQKYEEGDTLIRQLDLLKLIQTSSNDTKNLHNH